MRNEPKHQRKDNSLNATVIKEAEAQSPLEETDFKLPMFSPRDPQIRCAQASP